MTGSQLTAAGFAEQVEALRPPAGKDSVRMGDVFALAKRFGDLPVAELDRLLDSDVHLVRVGALRVMGNQAVHKKAPEALRAELYALYLRRTDRINTWDLVDLSAHQVVGGYLLDKPRDVLYRLAGSEHWWERRIAMMATLGLVRAGEVDDTYALAEILVDDSHEFVRTVVGGMLREAGKHDRARLLAFLDRHAATAPRVVLRFAIEHLEPQQRAHYLSQRQGPGPGSPAPG
ncbi:DNA alkylation repair protein [Asanoa ishikariensis]|uniref:3-methyladenine DNA glycosylase AlkD n=1 Tax=Asanoa ishikariensis TaxID=137265 RepID=A0A1H3PGA0_9ACTN|nr:DNA alkylation repair protein [Asanoa ishikariensis]GIF67828.1 DNA alkylation repair protein [Asanoa ishikariensis]SDZ00097.1 3-methyladenine DNA glycosylase AlkD [Asanoa ishikariensis]